MGRFFRSIDWLILALLTSISCFGLFTLLSIDSSLFFEQLVFLIIGFVCLVVISNIDGVVLRYFSPYIYIISVILLVLTYIFPEVRGSSRWIPLGPIQIQPSELTKPFFLLTFASVMAWKSPRYLKNIPLHLVLFLIPALLIFEQPDLGTTIVYFSGWFSMMFAGGVSFLLLGLAVFIFLIAAPLGWNFLEPFQKLRILTFVNPAFDPRGAGYNAFQAMIAVGSGQLFGRGLGRGTQSHLQFLPEFHTDFIYATLIEELGFLGGIMLIFLYGVLLWLIIKPLIKQEEKSDISYFYAIGVFGMILTQVIVNAGMNMGIIPITGITLPLISSGGSSVISISILFGILFSLRKSSKADEKIDFIS